MKSLMCVIYFSISIVMAGSALAQTSDVDADKNDKALESKQAAESIDSDLKLELQITKSVLSQTFDKVELTEEQGKKIKSLIDKNVVDLVKAKREQQSQLSSKERKQYLAHFRFARLGHFTVDRAANYALSKLELSKERMTKYVAAQEKAEFFERKFNNEIVSVLTEEQRTKLPMFSKQRSTERRGGVVLPNMKTDDDVAVVKEKLGTIESMKIVNVNKEKNTVTYDVEAGSKTFLKIKSFAEEGIEQFKGFSMDVSTGDDFAELLKPVDKPRKKQDSEAAKKTEATAPSGKKLSEADDIELGESSGQ